MKLALVFALCSILQCGLGVPTKDSCATNRCSCADSECEIDATTQKKVENILEHAFNQNFLESDTCAIAHYVRTQLNTRIPPSNWVVMVGLNSLLTSGIQYSSKYNYERDQYMRVRYSSKHDFEIFRARDGIPPPDDVQAKMIGRASPRLIKNIASDMSARREWNFEILSDEALYNSDGIYSLATKAMYDEVNAKVCSGDWVFVVSSYDQIGDPKLFCASYAAHPNTTFRANWKRTGATQFSHSVLLFSPAKEE